MEEDLDQALQVDVLIASMKADHREATDALEYLAKMLEQALPESTTVKRGGWFMAKEHPVEELTVRFDDFHYQIVREKHGSFTARAMKIVRGVVLKTTEIPLNECIDNILQSLAALAQKNAQARRALNKFVLG